MKKLKRNHYRTIVIDPPWEGPGATPNFKGKDRGPSVSLIPYQTMKGVELARMRVGDIATPDGQLWIWTTSRSVGDAQSLAQLWGFNYRALFVWKKKGLGMGRHARSQCEFLLWAGRKGARLVKPKECPPQVQEWPNPRAHSAKPAQAYTFMAGLSDAPRIDIFARQTRQGFDKWGNQEELEVAV